MYNKKIENFRSRYCFPNHSQYNPFPAIRNTDTVLLHWNKLISDYDEINREEREEIKRYLCDINYKETYLKTYWWHVIRHMRMSNDGFKCTKCGSTKKLTVHHWTYEHKGEELLFMETITTLCKTCHDIEHGRIKKPMKDKFGRNVVVYETESEENDPEKLKYFIEKIEKFNNEITVKSNNGKYITVETDEPSNDELRTIILQSLKIYLKTLK